MKQTQTLIQILENFFKGGEVGYYGEEKTRVKICGIGLDNLKRVWNDGHGLISFAEKSDGVLLINKLFCSKKEIQDIQNNLKVKFAFVELGYPDYYFHGLESKWKLNK